IQGAERNQVMADDATPRIQHQDDESFLGRIEPARLRNIADPILLAVLRSVDKRTWDRTLANAHDLELERKIHGLPSFGIAEADFVRTVPTKARRVNVCSMPLRSCQ